VNKNEITAKIKEKALDLGFTDIGFTRAKEVKNEENNLINWLNAGYHADMQYLVNNINIRLNPELLLENTKTIISLISKFLTKK